MKCSCLIGLTSTASAFLAISLSAQCPLPSIILSSRWRYAVVAGLRRLTWRGIDMSNETRPFLVAAVFIHGLGQLAGGGARSFLVKKNLLRDKIAFPPPQYIFNWPLPFFPVL
jgi:hypothetical protein